MASSQNTIILAAVFMLLYFGTAEAFFSFLGSRDVAAALYPGIPTTTYPVIANYKVDQCASDTVATFSTNGAQYSPCTSNPNYPNICVVTQFGDSTLQLVFTTNSDANALKDISSLSLTIYYYLTASPSTDWTIGPYTVNMNNLTPLAINTPYYITTTGLNITQPSSDVQLNVELTVSGGDKVLVCFYGTTVFKVSS